MNDVIDGREGNDNLNGGAGDDTYIFSAGHDKIDETGGGGTDTIRVRDSYAPSDVSISFVYDSVNNTDLGLKLTDSDGNTMLVYNHANSTTNMVEHVVFADSTDWAIGSMEIETHGTSGADGHLYGHDVGDASSNDTIYGYAGNDVLSGGNGDDLLYGGDDDDTIYALIGYDIAHGDGGADTLSGGDHATLYGDAGNDTLTGGSSSSDVVTMFGGDGADTLTGGAGSTIMNGGAGADTMYAASGAIDIFAFDSTAFGAVDTISSFQQLGAKHDKLDISDILDGHYNPGTDILTNFAQIQDNGSNSELYVDTTGSGTFGSAQHIATVQGVTGLTDEDAMVTAGILLAA